MNDSISAPFIRYPIATSLLMAGILFVGLVAFPLLPVAPLPQVDFPTIQVQASLPGASPETMASSVAQPLAMSENKPSRRTFLGAVIGGVIGGGRAISNNKTEEEVAHDALAGGAMGAIAVNLPAVARRARRSTCRSGKSASCGASMDRATRRMTTRRRPRMTTPG